MTNAILSLSAIGLITLSAIALAARRRFLQYLPLVGAFLAVYLLDNLILALTSVTPRLQIIPDTTWGTLVCAWSGKLYCVLAALLVAWLMRRVMARPAFGLTLAQQKGSAGPALIVLLLAGIMAAVLGLGFDKGPFSALALVYLALMPGLNEELVYRGLLLGMADRISPPRWKLLQANIGWGALSTSLLFGLLHGFWIEAGVGAHFNLVVVFFNGLAGLAYAWQRERTGSLLFPVLTHGVIDFFIVFVRMV